ncbi:MAG: hypothetical protein OQJ99_04910 [Rhodospirillales bacterium]|nr:hypothetical protein [Rhodospirillales bacterium]MCW8861677.1 hypothetical protein [Rhodospirillales bacterium]MCW9003050.1 hypothetical protein [Rhodospirillales bacterium]MCW9039627.1 hypothetical protein [Rhodospirillales bacterium]
MDRPSLIFCILSLVISIGLALIAYPFAAIPADKLAAWKTPAESYDLPDMDLGDFGIVSVDDLISYYIENPPAPPSADAAPARAVRFQGC